MAFFSLLYESEASQKLGEYDNRIKIKKASRKNKEKQYEYVGNKLVRVQDKVEEMAYPSFYEPLNLDLIIRKIYDEQTYIQMQQTLRHLLTSRETIYYRQDIMKDFEVKACYEAFSRFKNQIYEVHQVIGYSEEVKEHMQKDSYYLKAITLYCGAINELKGFCDKYSFKSEGLKKLQGLLNEYIEGEDFAKLVAEAEQLKEQLEAIKYQLVVNEEQVWIHFDEEKRNYTQILANILGQFERETEFKANLHDGIEINSLEKKVLEKIAMRYRDLFNACHEFVNAHQGFIQRFIQKTVDELPFYIEFVDYMNGLKEKQFIFCYPKISSKQEIQIQGMYDLSLAEKKQHADEVMTNEIQIEVKEKGACITGANQGGKTTFVRSIGQIAYFTALGLPVAAQKARLWPYEMIYTHFVETENQYTNNGKLKEELIKVKETLQNISGGSLVIMNELFASTTMKDGYELGKKTITQFIEAGATVFCVTHIAGLAQEEWGLISLVAEVSGEERCYRVVRKPVDGRAYSKSLIQKYHLSYQEIKERLSYGS